MMKNLSGKDCASLAYGLNMLRLLLSMKLITEAEYNNIRSCRRNIMIRKKLCLFL